MDYLSRFHVLIDYPAKRLYLWQIAPNPDVFYPTEACRQSSVIQIPGCVLIPSAKGDWSVLSIERDSTLWKMGLKTGATLVDIDGKKVNQLPPAEVVALLGSDVPVAVRFSVSRKGILTIKTHRKAAP